MIGSYSAKAKKLESKCDNKYYCNDRFLGFLFYASQE